MEAGTACPAVRGSDSLRATAAEYSPFFVTHGAVRAFCAVMIPKSIGDNTEKLSVHF